MALKRQTKSFNNDEADIEKQNIIDQRLTQQKTKLDLLIKIFIFLLIVIFLFSISALLLLLRVKYSAPASLSVKTPLKQTPLPFSLETEELSYEPESFTIDDLIILDNFEGIIDEGEIFLTKGGNLYVFDTGIMEIREFSLPIQDIYIDNPAFSQDGRYLFFSISGDSIYSVAIYDFETGEIMVIEPPENIEFYNPTVYERNISPNNEYFVINSFTAPGDMGIDLFDFDGNFIGRTSGNHLHWSDDGSKLAITKGDFEITAIDLAPYPTNNSVYIIEVINDSLSQHLLLEATDQVSYGICNWLSNDKLAYRQSVYEKPFPSWSEGFAIDVADNEWWKMYSNPDNSFWSLDIIGGEPEELFLSLEECHSWHSLNTRYSPSAKWKIELETEDNYSVKYLKSAVDEKIKIRINTRHAIWRPSTQ